MISNPFLSKEIWKMNEITPMMKQYFEIKDKCRDCILFYRLGDFYEMFYEDAKIASKELELFLTGRDCGQDERAPMCGVPYHSASSYIAKLISKDYKVAICEQVEDPALAKGIVKREIIRIVTPGTLLESNILDEKTNNFLVSVYMENSFIGLSYTDISTGILKTTQLCYGNIYDRILDELSRLCPAEIILNKNSESITGALVSELKSRIDPYITYIKYDKDLVEAHSNIKRYFGNTVIIDTQYELSMLATDMLLRYLTDTQKNDLQNLDRAEYYNIDEYMILDSTTRRNLELTETIRERKKKGSLLSVIDKTNTSMGGRLLRQFLNQPLIDIHSLNMRLSAVGEIKDNYIMRMDLKEELSSIYDIERIISRLASGSSSLRDLISLKNSALRLPGIKSVLSGCVSPLIVSLNNSINELKDVYSLIDKSISDDPPINTKDGGYIKEGYNKEIDELIQIKTDGTSWVRKLEQEEKEKTQIRNLKIKYNKVFGYFIEITNSYMGMVPEGYIRKQTLANSERYITQELKDLEDKILGADARLVKLELEVLNEVREEIKKYLPELKATAYAIAYIDVLYSFAATASENNYCRPEITASDEIRITEGRHPVVETLVEKNQFVPNDVFLDLDDFRFSIITGPNMAGKSTYMRQTALIVVLAQIGSFVPAASASIGLVDRIFTRVGASDDLSSGQSTFMIEMMEVANILQNATKRSLLILDEIGRGTSTFDGLSIAWAVTEYISKKENIGARTLFATHYHELTELEGKLAGVRNYCVKVLEQGEEVIFLRKIVKGGADESYGIHVAKLAGIPQKVTDRARAITEELKKADINRSNTRKKMAESIEGQLDILGVFAKDSEDKSLLEEFAADLRSIEISKITPIDALNKLYSLQSKYLKG
jgi:DNA mismatch repair protein MutS